jgi:hypothetical protein
MSATRLGEHEHTDSAAERLIADIMVAVLSLEYGAVTISVRDGWVVQIERHEKQRLATPAASGLIKTSVPQRSSL